MGAKYATADERIALPLVMIDSRLFPKQLLALSQATPGGVTWEAVGSLTEAANAAPSGPIVAITTTMAIRLGAALWRGEDAHDALALIIAQTEQTLFDIDQFDGRCVLFDRGNLVAHPSESLNALALALGLNKTEFSTLPASANAQITPRFGLLAEMIIAHDPQARALSQRFAEAHLAIDVPAPPPPSYALLQKAVFGDVPDAAIDRINGALRGQLRKLRAQAEEDHTTIGLLRSALEQAQKAVRQNDDLHRDRENLLGHLLLRAENNDLAGGMREVPHTTKQHGTGSAD